MNQEKDNEPGCEIAAGVNHKTTDELAASAVPNGDNDFPQVVFRTKASYSSFLWLLLGFALFIVLVGFAPAVMGPTSTATNKVVSVITLLGTVCFMVLVNIAIVPVAFEVRSNRSIGVVTTLCTYNFPGAVSAHDASSEAARFRPRIKFVTDLSKRIIIRRTSGMDLLICPQDENGFIQAVHSVQPQQVV